MTDRELQELLDARASPEAAAQAVKALPSEQQEEAWRLVVLARLAAAQVRPEVPAGFTQRCMVRVRTRPAPRRTLATWVLSPRISPLAAAAGMAAAALLAAASVQLTLPGSTAPRSAPALASAPEARVIRLQLEAPGAREVHLAGDFNGWRPEATPLRRTGTDTWAADVPLTAGRRYQYMFVVDGRWVTDPSAPAHVDDGFGHRNAILDI